MISTALGKVFDKLPVWAKVIWFAIVIIGSVYFIAKYGFFSFILRLIFSP